MRVGNNACMGSHGLLCVTAGRWLLKMMEVRYFLMELTSG